MRLKIVKMAKTVENGKIERHNSASDFETVLVIVTKTDFPRSITKFGKNSILDSARFDQTLKMTHLIRINRLGTVKCLS